jgi:sugar phosphate permease
MFTRDGRRFFVNFCAFVGAGWFGDWVYGTVNNGTWDDSFTWIIVASLAAALLFTMLGTDESK